VHKKTWRIEPPYVTVMGILEKKGSLTDEELFHAPKASHEEMGGRRSQEDPDGNGDHRPNLCLFIEKG